MVFQCVQMHTNKCSLTLTLCGVGAPRSRSLAGRGGAELEISEEGRCLSKPQCSLVQRGLGNWGLALT